MLNLRRQVNKETADAHMLLCEIAKHEISNTGLDGVMFQKEKKMRGTNTEARTKHHTLRSERLRGE